MVVAPMRGVTVEVARLYILDVLISWMSAIKEREKSRVTQRWTEIGKIWGGAGLEDKISSSIWDMLSLRCLLNTLEFISIQMIFKSIRLKDTSKEVSVV